MENKNTPKTNKPTNIHNEHRKRMREKLQTAPQLLSDHEILEMLLYYSIPRGNTNPMAHELLFLGKTFKGILDLSSIQLNSIDGLGPSTETFLTVLREFYIRLEKQRLDKRHLKKITMKNISEKLHKTFFGINEEKMVMLTLDNDCHLLNTHFVASGSAKASLLSLRTIVAHALTDNASYVIIAHNHPNNVLAPSKADIETTRNICEALAIVSVPVIEHYIVTATSEIGIISQMSEEYSKKLH